jgi:uncharacterized protein (TIGR02599 family)
MNPPLPAKPRDAFTLIELLVSTVILTLLLLVMVSITDSTRKVWSYTAGRIEQFRDAREAFESVTRNLSQATLNTYWDYQRDSSGNPLTGGTNNYVRQSELRFISGPATALLHNTASANITNTHALFCQIPLGIVTNSGSYPNMRNLLNTCGYFIEFQSDKSSWPPFIAGMANPPVQRYRFRLMEMVEPADSLTLYKYTNGTSVYAGVPSQYTGLDWFTVPFGQSSRPARVLAENIVAMVLLPKLTTGDQNGSYTDASLAPNFLYSSTGVDTGGNPQPTVSDPNLNPINQLPPVVQITIVAVDDASFNRFVPGVSASSPAPAMPDLGLSSLFQDATKYGADLDQFQSNLLNAKLNYRIFSTNVSLKAAKWSHMQVK